MNRCRRWRGHRHRYDLWHNGTARLRNNGHWQKLRSRLFGGPPSAVSILVAPLENLVGVDPVLSRHSRDRRARYKRRLNDAALLLGSTMNPFRRAPGGNLNRLGHKAIVGPDRPLCLYGDKRTLTIQRHRATTLRRSMPSNPTITSKRWLYRLRCLSLQTLRLLK
jgi:hypothetical protein